VCLLLCLQPVLRSLVRGDIMSWESLKHEVEQADNLLTVTMERLRELNSSGKLGVHVRKQISRQLEGMGIGHVPVELPSYQDEQVRLYKRGTPVGDLISIVLSPGEQNDRILVERFGNEATDYYSLIEKIRELVSE